MTERGIMGAKRMRKCSVCVCVCVRAAGSGWVGRWEEDRGARSERKTKCHFIMQRVPATDRHYSKLKCEQRFVRQTLAYFLNI